jgi:hypothetical protein
MKISGGFLLILCVMTSISVATILSKNMATRNILSCLGGLIIALYLVVKINKIDENEVSVRLRHLQIPMLNLFVFITLFQTLMIILLFNSPHTISHDNLIGALDSAIIGILICGGESIVFIILLAQLVTLVKKN